MLNKKLNAKKKFVHLFAVKLKHFYKNDHRIQQMVKQPERGLTVNGTKRTLCKQIKLLIFKINL